MMTVYKVTHSKSGKVYVGKTVKGLAARRRSHYAVPAGRATHFSRALKAHPEESFKWEEVCFADCKDELNALEREYIAECKANGLTLYNMTDGGDGGGPPGDRHQNYGRRVPDDVRRKISESLKGKMSGELGTMYGRRGSLSPMYGKNHSDETRMKLSAAHKGIDKPHLIGKMNPSAREVVCTTTGESFAYATLAAEKYGTDLSDIIKVCKGKKSLAKGRSFAYAAPGAFGWVQV